MEAISGLRYRSELRERGAAFGEMSEDGAFATDDRVVEFADKDVFLVACMGEVDGQGRRCSDPA